ncbi:hypothetical protein ACFPRL_20555 [Pseudoclavibacter helvolus]
MRPAAHPRNLDSRAQPRLRCPGEEPPQHITAGRRDEVAINDCLIHRRELQMLLLHPNRSTRPTHAAQTRAPTLSRYASTRISAQPGHRSGFLRNPL